MKFVYCLQQCYFVYVVPFLCIKMGTNDKGTGEIPVPRPFDGTEILSFYLAEWTLRLTDSNLVGAFLGTCARRLHAVFGRH
jgi:hypothetical protein